MPYLFVARTHGACAYTQIFKRQREGQTTILSLVAPCAFTPLGCERTRQNLGPSHRHRACVRQISIWHHIYWNMASYLLEYAVIFIEICCHIH